MSGDESIRESTGTVAIWPTTERKGKAKQYLIVMWPSAIEIHKSAKERKNKKAAKYRIEFAELFNISVQVEPNQVKGECIVLMLPDQTFFLLPADKESNLNDWFELLIERARNARSVSLYRVVYREEFFEVAWDVIIGRRPKLRKSYAPDVQFPDLADKIAGLQGRRRLVLSATSFLLFKIGVTPTATPGQPFDRQDYLELPINVVANYGKQEKYFFVRIGRCSELGTGEIWMATESNSSATQLHTDVSRISERDAEKRREMGILLSVGGISASVLKSKQRRERALEKKKEQAETRSRLNTVASEAEIPQTQIVLPPPPPPITEQPTVTVMTPPPSSSPIVNHVDKLIIKNSMPKKHSLADMAFKIGSKLHYSNSASSTNGAFTSNPEYTDAVERPAPLKLSKKSNSGNPPAKCETPRTLSPGLYKNIAEDYMSYDAHVDSRKASVATGIMSMRQMSVLSESGGAHLTLPRQESRHESDYTTMFDAEDDHGFRPFSASVYTSSCDSFATTRTDEIVDDGKHNQRALSLGSKPTQLHSDIRPEARAFAMNSDSPASGSPAVDDFRKRALSAGNKGWTRFSTASRKTSDTGDSFARDRRQSIGKMRRARTDDHIEIDFGGSRQSSNASIDSPNPRSRNSSFGMQVPNLAKMKKAMDGAMSKLATLKVKDPEPSASSKPPVRDYDDESDYVPMPAPKSRSGRTRAINTIVESTHSSSPSSRGSEVSISIADDDADDDHSPPLEMMPGEPVTNSSLEYMIITAAPPPPPTTPSNQLTPVQAYAAPTASMAALSSPKTHRTTTSVMQPQSSPIAATATVCDYTTVSTSTPQGHNSSR